MLLELIDHMKDCPELAEYKMTVQRNDNEVPFSAPEAKILLVRMGGAPSDKDINNSIFDLMLFSPQNPSLEQVQVAYETSLAVLKYLRHNHNRGTIHNIVVTNSLAGPYLDQTQRRFYSLSITASQTLMKQ